MDESLRTRRDKEKDIHTLGIVSSISLAVVTLTTFVIAVMTPPASGPFAVGARIVYPYTDILTRYPRDYIWMFPAMLLMLIIIVYMVCIDQYISPNKRIYSRIALVFGSLAAGIIFVDYFIQVTVIQPSLLNNEVEGISLLTQYNPHGIFIALEEAGYLILSIAILFLAPVFTGFGKIGTALKWTSVLNFTFTILSLIVISFMYGINREYRFEVAVITFDFITLILIGLLTAKLFIRREL